MKTVPGTDLPICLVCESEIARSVSPDIGNVCRECAQHCAEAVILLAANGLTVCREKAKTPTEEREEK